MSLPKHISRDVKGFTLIELLVVIGILGILAAGLLAAIDPLEQLKKGRDQTRRGIAVELTNATARYYAVFGSMPWGNAATAGTLSAFQGAVDLMTGAGELKPTFMGALPAGAGTQMTVLGGVNAAGFSVCFDPESKSISRDPTTLFSAISAYPPTAGTNPGTADSGYFFCTR